MALFTVFGSPIAHSLSPQIQLEFADQFGLVNEYRRSLSSPGRFAADVAYFFRHGGSGANVTVPFKQQAYQLVTHTTLRARQAGAVNTLMGRGAGQVLGDNTDGLGLVADLRWHLAKAQVGDLSGKTVLLLGAGGAARGVVGPLLDAGVARLTVANRTEAKAADLVDRFADSRLAYCSMNELPAADIIIQATSVALQQQALTLPANLAAQAVLCYDMSYGATPTKFLQWAAANGCANCLDGLGMLVEQAALSFALWHDGLLPDSRAVITKLLERNTNE
ncbi:shikimate dehydrogenase [Pseudidiomarina planktonica]|uniref:Shikimate dehydrogenase (NADP(+)) n=1 Tax=Pseudidiomarina planktonica TaxID=1323738 RepID=A0A1Y6E6J5_9GAMM|nr:shikimate dehydrogenase [Pseudidiomarina planktonica]RUO66391.1 shikimate dehydrogenase [Pseudidiomarina planktonica]SMQ58344.1 shikimate dehydrogenase [Pseudidiomarina planktonica]